MPNQLRHILVEPNNYIMPAITRSAYNSRNRARDTQSIVFEGRCRLEDVCCICLSSVRDESVYHTPCGHTYHTTCLRDQIQRMRGDQSRACAMCRCDLRQQIRAQPNLCPEGDTDDEEDSDVDFGALQILWVPIVTQVVQQGAVPTSQGMQTNTTMTLSNTDLTNFYAAPLLYENNTTFNNNTNMLDVYRSVWNNTATNIANSTYSNVVVGSNVETPQLEYWPWHDASMGIEAGTAVDGEGDLGDGGSGVDVDEEAQEWVNSLFGHNGAGGEMDSEVESSDSDGSIPSLHYEW